MRRGALAVLGLSAAVMVGVGFVVWRDAATGSGSRAMATGAPGPLDSTALAPEGERVRVLVLNGTDRSGLARRAMHQLRDHGYDVVDFGNAPEKPVPTTVEVVRGREALGERLVRALGAGTVRSVGEPLPYLDVRVTVGVDWEPSPQSFRP